MQDVDLENARVSALHKTGLLDSAPELRFDRFTRIGSVLADAPIALISLVDVSRQWFKSCIGLDVAETPRSVAFCDVAIRAPEVMVVLDAAKDDRFADNPLVTGGPKIRFYAGAPLVLSSGHAIGTLCVIGHEPRDAFPAQSRAALADLASLVVTEIEHREAATARELTVGELQHRFGNMFSQILGLISLTMEPDQTAREFVAELRRRMLSLNAVHRRLAEGQWEAAPLGPLVEAAVLPVIGDARDRIRIEGPSVVVSAQAAMSISMAVFELATNSIKYGALGPGNGTATISWSNTGEAFQFIWAEQLHGGGSERAGTGFGSKLLNRIVPAQLGGEASYDITPDLVRYAVSTTLKAVT